MNPQSNIQASGASTVQTAVKTAPKPTLSPITTSKNEAGKMTTITTPNGQTLVGVGQNEVKSLIAKNPLNPVVDAETQAQLNQNTNQQQQLLTSQEQQLNQFNQDFALKKADTITNLAQAGLIPMLWARNALLKLMPSIITNQIPQGNQNIKTLVQGNAQEVQGLNNPVLNSLGVGVGGATGFKIPVIDQSIQSLFKPSSHNIDSLTKDSGVLAQNSKMITVAVGKNGDVYEGIRAIKNNEDEIRARFFEAQRLLNENPDRRANGLDPSLEIKADLEATMRRRFVLEQYALNGDSTALMNLVASEEPQ